MITSKLEGSEYAACRSLTDKASGTDVEHVIDEVENETDDAVREYYRFFLNLIAEKNPGVFEEIRRDDYMKYPALMKVLEDEVNEKEQETTVSHIREIMIKLKYTAVQAMDLLNVPQAQRETYAGLIGSKNVQ